MTAYVSVSTYPALVAFTGTWLTENTTSINPIILIILKETHVYKVESRMKSHNSFLVNCKQQFSELTMKNRNMQMNTSEINISYFIWLCERFASYIGSTSQFMNLRTFSAYYTTIAIKKKLNNVKWSSNINLLEHTTHILTSNFLIILQALKDRIFSQQNTTSTLLSLIIASLKRTCLRQLTVGSFLLPATLSIPIFIPKVGVGLM